LVAWNSKRIEKTADGKIIMHLIPYDSMFTITQEEKTAIIPPQYFTGEVCNK
jgi:hypothetical protein